MAMHSSVRLETLSKLPRDVRVKVYTYILLSRPDTALKKAATAAAHGDLEVLWDVYDIAQTTPLLEFLPVFYAGLDGAPIPDLLAQFNSLSTPADVEFFDEKISRACLCFHCILFLDTKGQIPVSASPDLWPRLWLWIDFISTYRDHIPDLKMLENQVVYYNAVLSLILLRRHDTTAAVINATLGVHVIIVCIWVLYLQDPEVAGKTNSGISAGTSIVASIFRKTATSRRR
ncbi:hypothetical protein B0H13DRAFT_2443835 [Mycena leptocephala]|nr:hypothetical protein B0H13DRAFT_2443835 [Mycena leptocephala]